MGTITKIGHIEIQDNKVIFVYYELGKPVPPNGLYISDSTQEEIIEIEQKYVEVLKKYNASLRSVEVSNVNWSEEHWVKGIFYLKINNIAIQIKHNQSCEAEVNGKAEITKIL